MSLGLQGGNNVRTLTRLLITRHGETLWNRRGLIQGHQPVPLSDRGRVQARELGKQLRGVDLAAAYISDLVRTTETASLALESRDMPVYMAEGLRECHYGAWEGLPSNLEDGEPPELSRRSRVGKGSMVPHPNAAPGGETLSMVLERFCSVVEQVVTIHAGQTVLLVSHDGPIRAWFSQLLGWDLGKCWEIEIRHCGLSEVWYIEGKLMLARLDGTVDGLPWRGTDTK